METNNQDGMSLVDLMIAALIGIVLIGAVMSIVVHQGHVRQANSETTLALNAVVNNFEQIRDLSDAQITGMNGHGFDVPGTNGEPGGLHAVPNDPDNLPGQLTVYPTVSAGETIFTVIATVTWTGVTGRRVYSMRTLMTERR